MNSFELKKDIYWVGSLNPELKVFDVIMETNFGTTYNSYLVKGDKKIALFETVKEIKFPEFLKRLKTCVDDISSIDYIVLNHTEPDHSGSVGKLLDLAPNAKVVGSKNTIQFLKEILNKEFSHIVVDEGDSISLGNKTLKFIMAPFLHWPDSMYTYIEEDKILVTCDSFGSHYSFEELLLSKLPLQKQKDYKVALRYYYMSIFSPFRKYVLEGIEKIKDLKLDMIFPGHGPILDVDIDKIIETYKNWATLKNPNDFKTVIIPYVTSYGYTRELAEEIEKGIKDYNSTIEIKKYDLDVQNFPKLEGEILREFLWADGIIFGSCTINGDTLPIIWSLLSSLNPIVHCSKYVSAFGSYGWSGEAVQNITDRLNQLRMNVVDGFKVNFRASRKDLDLAFKFGKDFGKHMYLKTLPEKKSNHEIENLNPDKKVMRWVCSVCGQAYTQIDAPEICPACGVGKEFFVPYSLETKLKKVENDEKIIIIGGGIAALSAAKAIKEHSEKSNVIILSNEKEYPYYRTLLSEMIGEDISRNKFLIKPEEWYKDKGIHIKLNIGVEEIIPDEKRIRTFDDEYINYDKLIIATGARSMIPSIGNSYLEGIFTVRNEKDVEKIKKYCVGKRKAVVIGGGILGLESACGLQKLGMDVSVVEVMQRILPRQLDEEGSKLFESCIVNSKIKLYKNSKAERFLGNERVEGIYLESGELIDAEIVIINSGIIPNKELAHSAEIKFNRGIVVDDEMKTSEEFIYACGDVAEYNGNVVGLWQVSSDQGKIAGLNAIGIQQKYEDKIQPVTFEGVGTKIFSIGGILESKDFVSETSLEESVYKRLNFKNGEISSGILIGDIEKGALLIKSLKDREKKENILKKFYK
ncbi:MAG: FAD-dependent oxidoreductase [Cetobacterium sp.]